MAPLGNATPGFSHPAQSYQEHARLFLVFQRCSQVLGGEARVLAKLPNDRFVMGGAGLVLHGLCVLSFDHILITMYIHVMNRAPSYPSSLPSLPCACATLRRAARALTQCYNSFMRSTALEVTQFTLLQALGTAGELTQGQLGIVLAIDSTTLSRTLQPLQKNGWIATRPGADRRQRYLHLSTGGRHVLEQALPHWRRAQEALRRQIGDKNWRTLLASADALAAAALAG